jgi:ribulose kinase
VEDAMEAMGQGFDSAYHPNPKLVQIYARRYRKYEKMGGFIEKQLTGAEPQDTIETGSQAAQVLHN